MMKKPFVFAVWSALSFLLLASGCSPNPGKSCDENDKLVCLDPTTALECKGGTWQAVGCLGADGCKADESRISCDVSMAKAGDVCREKDDKRYSCSQDAKTQLRCKQGKWATIAQCTGQSGCSAKGLFASCPEPVSNEGDECDPPTSSDKKAYTCSTDKKSVLACRDGKWRAVEQCLGKSGCDSRTLSVRCDGPTAEAGKECSPEDKPDYACSSDGKSQLICASGVNKWMVNSACRGAEGCTSNILGVKCDRTIREPGESCTKDGDAACSTDGKTVLECKNGKMETNKVCPKSCVVDPLYIKCEE